MDPSQRFTLSQVRSRGYFSRVHHLQHFLDAVGTHYNQLLDESMTLRVRQDLSQFKLILFITLDDDGAALLFYDR